MSIQKLPPEVSFSDKLYGLFINSNPLEINEKMFSKLGNTYSIISRLAPSKFIFTKDPKLTDYFLRKNHKNYEKSYIQAKILRKYVGKGLLTNTGEDWRKQRRIIQQGFSHAKIEALLDTIYQEVSSFFHKIPENESMDFYELYNKLAFRIVAKSLFSSQIKEEEFLYISKVLTKAQAMFTKEVREPIPYILYNTFGYQNSIFKEIKQVRNLFLNIINERKQSEKEHNDLLDILLQSKYEDSGLPMETEQLIDEIMILFIAGHETTANSLSFTTYLLGKNSIYIEKLRESICNEDAYSIENLMKNSLLQNINNESLRLFPPAWAIDREALNDDSFEKFSWQKNMVLVSNVYALNRDESNWERPNEFIPERFLDASAREKLFIPFGNGPRYCIGEHFAKLEMNVVLTFLVKNYNISMETNELQVFPYVTLRPKEVLGKLHKYSSHVA